MVTAKRPADTNARVAAFGPQGVPKSLDDMGRILRGGTLQAEALIAERNARPKKKKPATPETTLPHRVATSLAHMAAIPAAMAALVAKETVRPVAIDPDEVKKKIVSGLATIDSLEQAAKTFDLTGHPKSANLPKELAVTRLKGVIALNLQLAKHFENSDKPEAFEALFNAHNASGRMARVMAEMGKLAESAVESKRSEDFMNRALDLANRVSLD